MMSGWYSRPSRGTVSGAVLCVAGLLMLLLAGVAYGKGEYEPNDSRATAAGPLAGGTTYTATRETDNDVDWYRFYVKTYSQMDFWATIDKSSPDCSSYSYTYMKLYDKDGEELDASGLYPNSTDVTEHLLITLNPGRYYLRVNETTYCTEERYSFGIKPASALTASEQCGEAIIARNESAPELAKLTGLIANNGNSLAKVDGVIAKQQAQLDALTRQWRKLKRRWKRNGRRISRGGRSRYWKGVAWRRLRYSKRRANQRLAAAKRKPKAKLEKANATREEILAKRLGLQTLGAQRTTAVSRADETIAEHC